jgi:hypothetical protein
MMNKKLRLLFLLVLTAGSVFGLDISLRPGGFVLLPAGSGNQAADGNERFNTGGGGGLLFDVDFASLWPNPLGLGYTAGIEGGLAFNPLKSPAEGNLAFYSAGVNAGLSYFPLSRLLTRVDGGLGVYTSAMDDDRGSPAFWWRAGGGAGFRFTPMFTLGADLGWRQYRSDNGSGVFNSGMYLGLALHVTFAAGGGSNAAGAGAAFVQDDGVYPAFLALYQRSPAGTITIRNHENAEIRDVRVSFRAAGYTASEFLCGTAPLVARGRSVELPLYADFSPELLRFTDTGRILGEVVIRYRFLGTERQAVQTVPVQVFNRNVFPPVDAAALAAFVSPAAPEVLEFAKHITGLARSNQRIGLNQNIQTAVWLFEGLRAAGIRFDDTHTGTGEVQFPAETLGFRTGNRTDIGLLYAAALEASGISAALIPLEAGSAGDFADVPAGDSPEAPAEVPAGDSAEAPPEVFPPEDFVVACYLGVNQAGAELLFNGLEKVLVVNDEVWLPLSMNAFNEGFMAAWDGGVDALNSRFEQGMDADFIFLETAWGIYPPAPLPAQGGAAVLAGGGDLARTADRAIQRYIDREIQPRTQAAQREAAANPTPALYNRLGILLTRSGRIAEARAAYERAAGMGLVSAMTNRGNLALIEKDYAAAERWFTQALAREPENRAALRGLEKISAYGDIQ